MPASSKESSGCSHSSLLPLLPGFLLPSGCHGGCANASYLPALWPPRGHAGTLAHCEALGHARSEQGRRFKALCRNAAQCLAGLLTSTTTAANTIVWHSSKMPGKATWDQANAPFLEGKEKPCHVDPSKSKSVEEIPWKWPFYFMRYLSIRVALKTSKFATIPSLALQFDPCDTASQGHFLQKTKQCALLSALSLRCCDSPLTKAVTRVISCAQDSYTTSNVILWAVIRSCSPRLR